MTRIETNQRSRPVAWRRFLIQFTALMAFWLLLSGHYDAFHVGLGVASVLLVIWMNWNLKSSVSEFSSEVRLRPLRLLRYLPWLIQEMILSAIHVAKVTLSPRMPLFPSLVRFKSEQPNDVARVILGNSITLTPGTLTIDIVEGEFLVHALTRNTADSLVAGKMQGKVARLFTDRPGTMVYEARRQSSKPGNASARANS